MNSVESRLTDFRAIWAGEAMAHILFRSDKHQLLAMLSPEPVQEGHTLIVPEPAIAEWQDMPPELAGKAMKLAQVVARRMISVLLPTPALINMHIMGYRVPHAHIKVIPSHKRDDTMPVFKSCGVPRLNLTQSKLASLGRELIFSETLTAQVEAGLAGNIDLASIEV